MSRSAVRPRMTRRAILIAAGASAGLACTGALFAQKQGKIARVAIISGQGAPTAAYPGPTHAAFRDELRRLGYIEGKNIHIEYRGAAGDMSRYAELVAEVVNLKVDAIVSGNSEVIRAAKAATKTIPIVMVTVEDPVAAGFVSSFARPGGNITGVTRLTRELSAKRLEILKEAVPTLTRVGLLYTQQPGQTFDSQKIYEDAARALSIQLVLLPVEAPHFDMSAAMQTALSTKVQALIVPRTPLLLRHRNQVFEFINRCAGRPARSRW